MSFVIEEADLAVQPHTSGKEIHKQHNTTYTAHVQVKVLPSERMINAQQNQKQVVFMCVTNAVQQI